MVISLEIDQRYIEKGFAGIRKSLDKFSAKGTLKEPVDIIFARLKGTTKKEDLAACDIIIEAIIENLDEKRKMFASLDPIVKTRRYFASNTSSISITETMTRDQAPGSVCRPALLQSSAVDEIGRGDTHDCHRR